MHTELTSQEPAKQFYKAFPSSIKIFLKICIILCLKFTVNVVMPLNSRNDLSSRYSFLEHIEQSIHLTFNIPSSELMKRSDVKRLLNSTVVFHCSCICFMHG